MTETYDKLHKSILDKEHILRINPLITFINNNNYTILENGYELQVLGGAKAGEYRNMFWKVKDNNDDIYYLMHIKEDIYTKISIEDIDKILNFKNKKTTWYLAHNGYIVTKIHTKENDINYYMHQVIMNVHDEDLTTFEKTVDHINHNKLDNRNLNLRICSMTEQNINRDKVARHYNACKLPDGITSLPKYVEYRNEIYDKKSGKKREFFCIENHPKIKTGIEKKFYTSKSSKVSIEDKFKEVNNKLEQLNDLITPEEFDKLSIKEKKLDLPTYIRLESKNNKNSFFFEKRTNNTRYNCSKILKSNDIQTELNDFIDYINKKYPDIKFEKYTIKNI